MKEEIKEYLEETIKRIEKYEQECETIEGQWNGKNNDILEEQAATYREIRDDLTIARSKLEYTVWKLNNYE